MEPEPTSLPKPPVKDNQGEKRLTPWGGTSTPIEPALPKTWPLKAPRSPLIRETRWNLSECLVCVTWVLWGNRCPERPKPPVTGHDSYA